MQDSKEFSEENSKVINQNDNNVKISEEININNENQEINVIIKKRTKKQPLKEKKENEINNIEETKQSLYEKIIEKIKTINVPIEFNINSKIDGIEVIFNIEKEKRHNCGCRHSENSEKKDSKLYYSVRVGLNNIYSEYNTYFILADVFNDTPEEIFEKIEEFKKYKWCKIKGSFMKNDESSELFKLLDEHINNNENEFNKCSVCYERCNEELQCSHILCMYCRQKMIKNKKKRCPVCRTKQYDIQIITDEDDNDEED